MAGRFGDINLTKYDDLFKNEETRQAEKQEQVLEVPADQIFPYARQPYTIDRPTPDLVRLMDSVERFGIMEPMVVRPRDGFLPIDEIGGELPHKAELYFVRRHQP